MTRFLKQLHKWIGLLIGIQVLLWIVSGLVISLLDPGKVSGRQWSASIPPEHQGLPTGLFLEPGELPAKYISGALNIQLQLNHGQAVYRVKREGGTTLIDASDGSVIGFDQQKVQELARQDFTGTGDVASIEKGIAPDMETRARSGPYWRVNFSDSANTSLYISATTGTILERRNDYWRVFDFFWMLHIMDYAGRQNFNNALIIIVALISIWIGISGFILLFTSFRRRDFNFLRR